MHHGSLIAAAALAAFAFGPSPAAAQAFASGSFAGSAAQARPAFTATFAGRHDARHHQRGIRGSAAVFGAWGYDLDSSYDDRAWAAESGNGWWHDRPERAFPRWMQNNQDCSRMWYSGDTLRC